MCVYFVCVDMEDAMIINKSAFERGFGHGSVYKTHTIDLEEEESQLSRSSPSGPTKRADLMFFNVQTNGSNSGTFNYALDQQEAQLDSMEVHTLTF